MYPSQVLFPNKKIIASLKVYSVVLRIHSWSVTPEILSLPYEKGGRFMGPTFTM